ncbi:MAG: hypothetical protein K9G42_11570 [Pedobacter sp.]|nr:hypothetical protein [Pedobacter sp.]
MLSIRSFKELQNHLQNLEGVSRIAVVNPTDENTMKAVAVATNIGLIHPILIGITEEFDLKYFADLSIIELVTCHDLSEASTLAVEMVKTGKADILMKGLVNTDILLKAILSKENGIVPFGNVVTFIAAMEIPRYPKLLFVTDPAVIPAPNYRQRSAIINYAIEMARNFGISKPKVALIHGTEKKNLKLPFMKDYVDILKDADNGLYGDVIISGPLDIFLALDQELGAIKNVQSDINGDADILIFPGFESANIFYKSMMTFADAQMGGILYGTEKPVVLTSRSDSAASKFNSIALACINIVDGR